MATTLDKPAGLPVFPPHADPAGDCLLARLLRDQPWRAELPWPTGFEGGIAHRLDNATSGAVLAADSIEELARIRDLFARHQLVKTYRMRSIRDAHWQHHQCTAAIAHDRQRRSRMVVQRGKNTPHRGKWYAAISEFDRLAPCLFEVRIKTGVMHQIRVHAAFLGIPLLGDRLYGGGVIPTETPPEGSFYLHHVGLVGPNLATDPLPLPAWARI